MIRYILFVLTVASLALAACAPSAQTAPTIDHQPPPATAVSPAGKSAPVVPSATVSSPPRSAGTVPDKFPEPDPSLPQAAAPNSAQALENVAKITYEALAAGRDLKPYIEGVMSAFGVSLLNASDAALATERLKKGLPLMFVPQVAEMANAFKDGDLMPLDSFIAAANERGAKQRGTSSPLTREYLTVKFASYTGKTRYEARQVLLAFILALSKERAKQTAVANPDPVWGDGLLDPLQVTLLIYSVSYAGTNHASVPVAGTSRVTALNVVRRPVNGKIPALEPGRAPGRDEVVDFIKDQLRDAAVEHGVQDVIEVPMDELSAVQVSVCASILLYGHQLTVTATPKEIYHKDGVKPWTTRIDVELSFQDDYWDNYLSVDRWIVQNLFDCKIPRRGPAEGKSLTWEVTSSLIKHGNFDVTPFQTGDEGKTFATWRTVPETTPESLRTFGSQRDAVGSVIVRAHGLVPGWSGLERSVSMLTDTGGVGSAQLRVIYYEAPYYRADGFYASYDSIPVTGVVCELDKPFNLQVNGQNPSGGKYSGEFAFAPAGTSGGSWKHTASTCEPAGGKCAIVNAGGTYQVKGVADGKPVIIMDPTTETMAIPGLNGKTFDVPGWQFNLTPIAGACTAK